MGSHYVPQQYLKGFEDPCNPGQVWVYDNQGGEARLVAIKAVAQSPGFYDTDVEQALATVESEGNEVLGRLLRKEPLDEGQRWVFALYIGTMIKRVPFQRERARESIPTVLDRVVSQLATAVRQSGFDHKRELRLLDAVQAICEKYLEYPPPDVVRHIRLPWPSLQIVDAIAGMAWRVLEASGPSFFITSDNPAFSFPHMGLARPTSELVLPLSTRLALHCCWQGAAQVLAYLPAKEQFVKEINRRVASTTTRLAFYHKKVDWLPHLLRKQPKLNLVRWK